MGLNRFRCANFFSSHLACVASNTNDTDLQRIFVFQENMQFLIVFVHHLPRRGFKFKTTLLLDSLPSTLNASAGLLFVICLSALNVLLTKSPTVRKLSNDCNTIGCVQFRRCHIDQLKRSTYISVQLFTYPNATQISKFFKLEIHLILNRGQTHI